MKKFVSYYRVSTAKQGESGLGLQAQRNSVDNYIQGKGQIIEAFTEVETGTRKKKRVEIYKPLNWLRKKRLFYW